MKILIEKYYLLSKRTFSAQLVCTYASMLLKKQQGAITPSLKLVLETLSKQKFFIFGVDTHELVSLLQVIQSSSVFSVAEKKILQLFTKAIEEKTRHAQVNLA